MEERKRLLERWIAVNGQTCAGLDGIPHPATTKLEIDHVLPVALGGNDRTGLRVLARPATGELVRSSATR
jgi:hypothetical protein